jgi:reverse gyrase
VSVSTLCKRVGIEMSTVQTQVKRRIIERFKVPDFRSLVKSAGLLKKVMAKLGVLDPAFVDIDEEPVDYEGSLVDNADIVQVVLGNATPVFNNLNESKDFYLFVKNLNGYLVASIIHALDNNNNNNYKIIRNSVSERNVSKRVGKRESVKLELWKYYNPKAPPLIC